MLDTGATTHEIVLNSTNKDHIIRFYAAFLLGLQDLNQRVNLHIIQTLLQYIFFFFLGHRYCCCQASTVGAAPIPEKELAPRRRSKQGEGKVESSATLLHHEAPF